MSEPASKIEGLDPSTRCELERELLGYLRPRLPPDVDPGDVLAEVWAALADHRDGANERTFALRVARLRLADFYRSRDSATTPPESPTPMSERLRQRSALQRAVESLPPDFREVARLHLTGVDNFEIAQRLGLHYTTVRARLSRALAKAQRMLGRS